MSAKDALLKHHAKQLETGKKKTGRKNKKPEFEVVKSCMKWMRDHNFSIDIVESKAVYNANAGRYLNGQTVAGMSDSVGCTPGGVGCFVEFKAKDRSCTLRDAQREFLREKILRGAFACVVDSRERLKEIYFRWRKQTDRESRIAFLLSMLPKQKSPQDFTLED